MAAGTGTGTGTGTARLKNGKPHPKGPKPNPKPPKGPNHAPAGAETSRRETARMPITANFFTSIKFPLRLLLLYSWIKKQMHKIAVKSDVYLKQIKMLASQKIRDIL
jgi:hypothetical protein